jgi:cob(I)alamin adenosyltransferase
MPIYTRTGDDGSTSLADGSRVSKSDARIELFGTLDEANCLVGLARAGVVDSDLDEVLEFIQHRLFNCAACLANRQPEATAPRVTPADTAALETAIDRYRSRIGDFEGFMLPGCDEGSARATCSTWRRDTPVRAASAHGAPTWARRTTSPSSA